MGIFDSFGKGRDQARPQAAALPTDGVAGSATRLVERLLDVGIDGKAPFDSAASVAPATSTGRRRRRSTRSSATT